MMGDIQREKSKDPIISEPAYIHATNGTIVHVPKGLSSRNGTEWNRSSPDITPSLGCCILVV
jgi:hypothetical protein